MVCANMFKKIIYKYESIKHASLTLLHSPHQGSALNPVESSHHLPSRPPAVLNMPSAC